MTPWAFIATSSAPWPQPTSSASAHRAGSEAASETVPVPRQASTNAARVTRRLPKRADQRARHRHRHDRAQRQAGEREPLLAVGELDPVAHGRQARREAAEQQPVEREDGRDRSTGAADGDGDGDALGHNRRG